MFLLVACIILALTTLGTYVFELRKANTARLTPISLMSLLLCALLLAPCVLYQANYGVMIYRLIFADYALFMLACAAVPMLLMSHNLASKTDSTGALGKLIPRLAFFLCLYGCTRLLLLPNVASGSVRAIGSTYRILFYDLAVMLFPLPLLMVSARVTPVMQLIIFRSCGLCSIAATMYLACITPAPTLAAWLPLALKHSDQRIMLSAKQNVFFIIADSASAPAFYETAWRKHRSQMEGFTFYANTLGVGRYTKTAVPFLLSGTWQHVSEVHELFDIAQQDNVFTDATAAGYDSSIIDAHEHYKRFCSNGLECKLSCKQEVASILELLYFSLLRISPLHMHLENKEGLQGLAKILSDSPAPYNSVYLWNRMLDNLTIGAEKPRFIFYVNYAPHIPYSYRSDCSVIERYSAKYEDMVTSNACTGELIMNFIRKLKELDLYESSEIIIAGDHGSLLPPGTYDFFAPFAPNFHVWNRNLGRWFPLLLHKPRGDTSNARISYAPSSLFDIRPTLCKAEGCPPKPDLQGMPLPDIAGHMERERVTPFFDLSDECFYDHNNCIRNGVTISVSPDLSDFSGTETLKVRP